MSRWKNKEAFIEWIDKERVEEQRKFEILRKKGDIALVEDLAELEESFRVGLAAYEVDLDFIKKNITNEIYEFLDAYSLDISLVSLSSFIHTIDEINYFKKSKFSNDGYEFDREIQQLKKKANTLQFFSNIPIEIKLPTLPHVSIFLMVQNLRRNGVNEDKIKLLVSFFDGRQRLPRSNITVNKELHKISNIADRMEKYVLDGSFFMDKGKEAELVELWEYYIPDIKLSYSHYGSSS